MDRWKNGQTDRLTYWLMDSWLEHTEQHILTNVWTDKHTGRWTYRQVDGQKNSLKDRQIGGKANRSMDRQVEQADLYNFTDKQTADRQKSRWT